LPEASRLKWNTDKNRSEQIRSERIRPETGALNRISQDIIGGSFISLNMLRPPFGASPILHDNLMEICSYPFLSVLIRPYLCSHSTRRAIDPADAEEAVQFNAELSGRTLITPDAVSANSLKMPLEIQPGM
jgi:hypothetical protein